ncbi:MAG: tRNA uridine-5-carboxymethylaminomethyl(34) synthesis GTPase MnmE [Candidatus Omnitrophica bacterium]|nr:tRNA uridine-5-carboxymethylaminomethyl(34) synthesis GTPase MnmE [Candidatus Omnitrophota bacterium]
MKKTDLINKDTICAISTPVGQGAIHIVRLSGKNTRQIAGKVFRFANKEQTFRTIEPRIMYYGKVCAAREVVDEACLVYFKSPHTYTSEDLVEIYLHGNYMIAHKVVQLLADRGARLAEKGEFTKRAFLNGRIDLSQAEAVNDLITAKTEFGVKVAIDKLQGRLSREMHELRQKIVAILSEIEAFVDFPDEDIEVHSRTEIGDAIHDVLKVIDALRSSYEHGAILRDGIRTVIVGKPNVGKSSLLNTLIKRDRALVSEIPGTTRDALEELIDINGILFRIIDTPGMRRGKDKLETLSIERSRVYFAEGQLFIMVLDGSCPLTNGDTKIFKQIADKQVIFVINKSDLPAKITDYDIKQWGKRSTIITVSTRTRAGIPALEKKLVSCMWRGQIDHDDFMITSERQFDILTKMQKSLRHAVDAFQTRASLEFLAFDLREALDHLAAIVGEVCGDDILDVVFSKFCIGK